MREVVEGRRMAALLFGLALCIAALSAGGAVVLPDFTGLVKKHGPAVVNISTTQKVKQTPIPGMEIPELENLPEDHPFGELFRRFFGEGDIQEFESESLGSGFIISDDGFVLTNYHVIEDAAEILVRLSDRRVLKAELVGHDARSDLALLRVKASGLPVVRVGDSVRLEVGEWVLAIGSPFGFDQSVTAGIVSAKGRALPRENYVPFIQTDVAINPGNSGGPLFNLDGEVVGINSQIYSRTGGYMGVSFAIPIEVAMDVVEQLKSSGRVQRGWLGVMIQEVTRDLAESFGMDKPQGALVARIFPASPAEEGGIEVGDVVLEFNNTAVFTSSGLPPIVGQTRVGQEVPVKVLRDGKAKYLTVRVGELPDDGVTLAQQVQPERNRLGVSVAELDSDAREMAQVDHGVQITGVAENGPAALVGIQSGDIVLMIDGKKVTNTSEFAKLVKALPAGKSIPVLVHRGTGAEFLALRIPK